MKLSEIQVGKSRMATVNSVTKNNKQKEVMKSKISVLIAALAALTAMSASAQTNTAPQGIVNQAVSWITTPDTNNLTLSRTLWRVETGPAIQNGVTLSDDLLLQRNFSTNGGCALLSITRNAGIAGTLVAQELGIGYNLFQKYDTEVTPYIAGGYRFDTSHLVGSIGVGLRHMINKAAYVGPDIRLDIAKKCQPMIVVCAGVAF